MNSTNLQSMTMNFNSQPHKEADVAALSDHVLDLTISTHSLTRRLTSRIHLQLYGMRYFNSQPHKEADIKAAYSLLDLRCISTHSLTRRLTNYLWIGTDGGVISTHSLTRRLTFITHYFVGELKIFQLTASQGG